MKRAWQNFVNSPPGRQEIALGALAFATLYLSFVWLSALVAAAISGTLLMASIIIKVVAEIRRKP